MSIMIKGYNPDVLSCLANLSNDEVFTPPEIANDMLDLLPQELFQSTTTTFLDPGCKSGVFLREIAKRLINYQMPDYENKVNVINEKAFSGKTISAQEQQYLYDLQTVVDHVMHKQLFGIAITELTGLISRRTLYCSKTANSKFSASKFSSSNGNIRFIPQKHIWNKGKCIYCGAEQKQYDRGQELESHAYEWIHVKSTKDIFDKTFDVIIMNPPYVLSDGGAKSSSKPIYQYFVNKAKEYNPRYLVALIQSRWFSGGKLLDQFRDEMLNDKHIKYLVDYTDSSECFPGKDISGGVCYFLWDKAYNGECCVKNLLKGKVSEATRPLNEFPTFVRYTTAVDIIKKIKLFNEKTMDTMVSARNPFGLNSTTKPINNGELLFRYSKGLAKYDNSKIFNGREYIDKWKTIVSYVSYDHAGQPDKEGMRKVMTIIEVLPPKSVCSEVYLLAGVFNTEKEALNLQGYLKTQFVRFLVAQIAVTQHITRGCFAFVPCQDFSEEWTDEKIYKKYKLTPDEIDFINSQIRPI